MKLPRISRKSAVHYGLALFFVGAALFFFFHEGPELRRLPSLLSAANAWWVSLGLLFTGLFVLVQGIMYWHSFRAVDARVSLRTALLLYLKRNLVAVFLPAGNFTVLAFFNEEVEKRDGVPVTKTVSAGLIHGIASFMSIAVVAVPVLGLLLLRGGLTLSLVGAFLGLLAIIGGLLWVFLDALRGGRLSGGLVRRFPGLQKTAAALQAEQLDWREFHAVWLWSCVIEMLGIVHVWVAMMAVTGHGDWTAAAIGYVVVLLWLSVSPVLRGMGGVEVSLTLVLLANGLALPEAAAATLLFRVFEFWGVLLLGAATFARGAVNLSMRLGAPVFIFLLGLVNVWSAVTPALRGRAALLRDFLPASVIHHSNLAVLTAGLALLLTGVYLFRGHRLAWQVAVGLTVVSILGHLFKGIDVEEAGLGLATLFALFYTQNQYFIKTDRRKTRFGWLLFGGALLGALIYGSVGFYYLDQRMFGWDFTWQQSIGNTLRLLLLGSPAGDLQPHKPFAEHFMTSISVSGLLAALLGLYYWLWPKIQAYDTTPETLEEAKKLATQYGRSGLDYFKTYADKQIFFTADRRAFLAYKIADSYAVVLETPIAPDAAARTQAVAEFEQFCRESGLHGLYYRVDAADLTLFNPKNRRALRIGQEARVDLQRFALEGKSAKALRNALSRTEREGLVFRVYEPPIADGLLQKLKAVSDAWLAEGKREVLFASGVFDENELKQQTLLTMETAGGKVLAFANLIPDFAPGEATYDLIRRLPEAPGYAMDTLMAQMILYLKNQGFAWLNLGLAPLAGLENSQHTAERALRFAAVRLKSLAHYQSLRAFKERFATVWDDKYLVYGPDFDLVAAPGVLSKVERG